jgi:hypothetical protein
VSQPQMIDRLALTHADDGSGRCRSCSSGAQTGRYAYPCSIKRAVDEARRRLDADAHRAARAAAARQSQ